MAVEEGSGVFEGDGEELLATEELKVVHPRKPNQKLEKKNRVD